jgi:putative transcriptional regulator
MAKKTKMTKARSRRLTEELLETARDMHASGLLTKAAHDKITMRHVGVAPAARKLKPSARNATLVRPFLRTT